MSEIAYSIKDELRKVLQALPRLSLKEILSYWMRGEVEEAEMYYRLHELAKELTWIEEIPEVFYKLYEESLEHAEKLLQLYEKLFPGERPIDVDLPSIEVILGENKLRNLLERGKLDDLLDLLMENEKIAAETYEYVQKVAEEPETKEAAQWLANIEREHFNNLKRLKEEYNSTKSQSPSNDVFTS